jgi:hypothetical protein
MGDLFLCPLMRLTSVVSVPNMLCFECAPVAQRIEHLPCWSLNGEWAVGTH